MSNEYIDYRPIETVCDMIKRIAKDTPHDLREHVREAVQHAYLHGCEMGGLVPELAAEAAKLNRARTRRLLWGDAE